MNDPLDLPLRDIHLPEAVSSWPPAWGWWALLALLAVLVGLGFFLAWWRRQQRASAVSLARMEFERICKRYDEAGDAMQLVKDSSGLLRRLSISLFPREQVASLTGEEWLSFLDEQSGDQAFSRGSGRILVDAPYRPALESAEVGELITCCEAWINATAKAGGRKR